MSKPTKPTLTDLITAADNLLDAIDDTFDPGGKERYPDDNMRRRAFVNAQTNLRWVLEEIGDDL